jgi:cardiolipin synthase A/B
VIVEQAVHHVQALDAFDDLYGPPIPERYQPFANLSAALGRMPAFAGNAVEPIEGYADTLRHIAEDIDAATSFVHVQFYILSRDDETEAIFQALERARARGVQVRVLYDQIGSRKYPSRRSTDASMTAAGIAWHRILPFNPLGGTWSRPDLRNHRKLVVIDGQIGYTGSMNLIRRNYFRDDQLYYDELVVRLRGPIVAQLQAVFITDWFCETDELLSRVSHPELFVLPKAAGGSLCQVLPSGSGHDDENNLKLFTAMIHGARHKLTIVNPYFVPDDSLMTAITSAAQRGVDVTMINSEAPDQFMVFHAQRSFYAELLRCGVKILLYRKPILLHSKFMTIDDDIAMVGSSNFDMRSFQLNLEVSLLCYDPTVVAALREVEALYIKRSLPLPPATWAHRPARTRLFENVMRLTSALQ